jgi:hypothetical protein
MKIIIAFLMGLCLTNVFASEGVPGLTDPNRGLLPSPYPVYTYGEFGVANNPEVGGARKFIPTDNGYILYPGCYIACYSHKPGVYPVGPDIFVLGQIRVAGMYKGRICIPEGYKDKDISAAPVFKTLCSTKIPSCMGIECWAGGDTGGWFGIQP